MIEETDATRMYCGGMREQVGHDSVVKYCHGKFCMMWRWEGGHLRDSTSSTRGYCGLAGRPE